MKICMDVIAARFKKGTATKFKGIIGTGNHRLPDAQGIPAQLPIVVISLALFAHEL